MSLNTEATRYLRVYLNMRLKFRTDKNLMIKNVKKAEDRVQCLVAKMSLDSGLMQKMQ